MAVRRAPRADLPEGTVTLFFTDIEGSTELLRTLGAGYAAVQERHRQLLRDAFGRFRGVEVDTQGDAFMVAFASANDAAAAAAECQRALAQEPWPGDLPVLVRMGLHTGEPERGAEGYIGMDVHIAARICSAGHGGQIVVSRETRDVVGRTPSGDLSFRPLGSHRLKDVPTPEQLFQLVAPGLTEDFPPLRTLGGATLPALHHRLVGRRRDLTATLSLLARPDVRLVTITGPGGAGKSRLALEIAGLAAVERPVHLVGLAPVSDPELVPAAISRALGVRESESRSTIQTIADTLSGTSSLLFVDNLEHLAPAAGQLAELLDLAPDLDILATSRVPLRLSGEYVVPLQPLSDDDAATLFVELAAARGVVLDPKALASVREICRRLDGLPLAIELVAARLVVLPPTEVLRALDHGLALEMEGPIDLPERQRTLRAALDWSYRLLSDSQRDLHGALATFVDGCTLEDARLVARAGARFVSDLEALVAWSLLRSDVTDGAVRVSMLETVREHALARLRADGALDELRRRHAERFLELALEAGPELAGSAQGEWLKRLEDELDNIRAALEWFLSAGRSEDALRAMSALSRFWRAHGHVSEARRRLSLGLDLGVSLSDEVRADALWTAARQATAQHDFESASPLLEDAAELFRQLGSSQQAAFALSELAWIALEHGETDRAESLCEEALREAKDTRARSGALRILSDVFAARDDFERAIELQEEALALRRTLDDPLLVSDATYHLGVSFFRTGEIDRARESFKESRALARSVGEEDQLAAASFMLAELDLFAGDLDLAEQQIHESLAVYTRMENDRDRAECLVVLAGVSAARGSFEDAARLLGAADALRGEAPLDLYELPVIERYRPSVEEALGSELFAEFRREGAGMTLDVLAQQVVSASTEE